MLVEPKKKVLAWSDSAIAGTGFGVVSKHVLGALHATGKYDINHLAINFHGDFVDKNVIPWQQQPARLMDPKDPHGLKMFTRSLVKHEYDFVWICNDLYVTKEVADVVAKVRQRYRNKGMKPPIFIYYYPVDCRVPDDGCAMVDAVDIPVCYTHHGRRETLKTLPGVKDKLKEVPHGVDTKAFSPASPQQIAKWKKQLLGVGPDTTVIVNVNRNSQRKQMQYAIIAFKEFRKHVPKSIMYMHTAVRDQGGDLTRAVLGAGLSIKKDVIFPVRYSPSNPAPLPVLNSFYNIGDIFLTTHLGEGWGLTVTEAMAAGVPVVAPDNTCMPQQLGEEGERGYIYPCNDIIWIDNSGYRQKGLIPDIVEMMVMAYKDGPKWNNPIVKEARKWAVKHNWNDVTKLWVKIFEEAEIHKQSTKVHTLGEEI